MYIVLTVQAFDVYCTNRSSVGSMYIVLTVQAWVRCVLTVSLVHNLLVGSTGVPYF